MEKLIEKLSRYHILNNLIPGITFLCLLNIFGIFKVEMDITIQLLFIGYFSGMTLSRIGSVIIEPLFQKVKIVKYADYKDFLKAEAVDPKVSNLLEDNNMFRTFAATFFVMLIIVTCNNIPIIKTFLHSSYAIILMTVLLLVLYALAYRKQTSYVRRRVNNVNDKPLD